MAKNYTATIEAKSWKEHTCAACGATYSYLLQRKVTGTAGNPQRAEELARKKVGPTLEKEVDLHPCPTCGLMQPDMVGQQRAKKHLLFFWLALVVFGVILI